MTVDQLITGLAACRAKIKTLGVENSRLRVDNQRVWESREEWKRKHDQRWKEIQDLRRKIKRCQQSRDRWRTEARKRGEVLYRRKRQPPRPRNAPWVNVRLSERDLERILEMPVRGRS